MTRMPVRSFALALALASAASPALARPAAPPQASVRTADLDLSQPAGADAFTARLRAAARQVCAPIAGRGAAQHGAWIACREDAFARALSGLDEATLSKLHAASAKRTVAAR